LFPVVQMVVCPNKHLARGGEEECLIVIPLSRLGVRWG
jgi:hypothetical protein